MNKKISNWWWTLGSIIILNVGLVGISQSYFHRSSFIKQNQGTSKVSTETKSEPDLAISYTRIINGVVEGFKPKVKLDHHVNLSIPHQYEWDRISGIGENAFANRDEIETVWIGEGVREIGSGAFRGCKNLKSVIIPRSVDKIGADVFKGCDQLNASNMASSSPVLFDWWMQNKIGTDQTLKHINLANYKNSAEQPFSVIGEHVFENCSNLQQIEIGDQIRVIQNYAFSNCPNLKRIVIPASVKKIGKKIFDRCPQLTRGGVVNNTLILFDWWLKNHCWPTQQVCSNEIVDLTIYRNSNNEEFTTVADGTISFEEPNSVLRELTISTSITDFSQDNLWFADGLRKLIVLSKEFVISENLVRRLNQNVHLYTIHDHLNKRLVRWGINDRRIHILTNTLDFYISDNNEIIGLTLHGQKAATLIIPASVQKINEQSFGGNQANLFDFSKIIETKELKINGEPFRGFTGEFRVKDKFTKQALAKAGVSKQQIKEITTSPKRVAKRWLIASLVTVLIFGFSLGIGILLYRRFWK